MKDKAAFAGSILMGGQSRRMGEDKSKLALDGLPMIRRVIDRLTPQVTSLILNTHEAAPDLDAHGLPVVPDAAGDHQGPLAGLLASLLWAEANKFSWVATVPVDTPFFPKDLVARSGGRLHPVFGLWQTSLAADLHDRLAQSLRSVHDWVALHDAGIADWPDAPYDPFFNINRPQDMTTALHILREFRP